MRTGLVVVAVVLLTALCPSTSRGARDGAGNPLARRYVEGETLRYVMKGSNRGRRYEAVATGIVKKDADGRFVEEFEWSNVAAGPSGASMSTSAASLRQRVSLDPAYALSIPNLASVDRGLVGPVLDFLNFYVDLQRAIKLPGLTEVGSHILLPHGTPNSWADGKIVLVGEDAVDFDFTLTSVDADARTAVVTVRHVPPGSLRINSPAAWMREKVGDTANNWVQVAKVGDGYVASVGKETFDVRITVSLVNGRILSATMDNPVEVLERTCQDAALSECGEPRRYDIRRQIEMTEQR